MAQPLSDGPATPFPPVLHLWRAVLLIFWALWWGGLTFYAGAAVPEGTAILGAADQGAVTRQVTLWHNRLLALFVVALTLEIHRERSRALLSLGLSLAVLWGCLTWQHSRMAEFLDSSADSLRGVGFYSLHAQYLWLTTGEWLLGLVIAWWLLIPIDHGRAESQDV